MMLLHNIPIIHNSIFLYQLDIRKNYNKIFEKQKIKQEANGFLTYSSTEYNILNEFKDLKKECEKSVGSLITDKLSFKDNNFKIFNSWITKTKPKGYSEPHTHSNSWISGVYYPKFSEDFKIRFYNDFLNPFHTKVKTYNIYNSKYWDVTPMSNCLVLFFSNMRHNILPNNSKEDRYSLAFNVLPNGSFGTEDSFLKLNIK
jgi:uncharacterized protein (TIGR02466 family)